MHCLGRGLNGEGQQGRTTNGARQSPPDGVNQFENARCAVSASITKLTHAVGWVQWIKWPAIETNVRRVTVDFQEAFAAIVARLAQALQLPEEKLVHVAMMRLDVIRNRRRHYLAAAEAEPTKGMLTQLMLAQALPMRRTVQMLPSDGHLADLML
jgi:hypothetical protein